MSNINADLLQIKELVASYYVLKPNVLQTTAE